MSDSLILRFPRINRTCCHCQQKVISPWENLIKFILLFFSKGIKLSQWKYSCIIQLDFLEHKKNLQVHMNLSLCSRSHKERSQRIETRASHDWLCGRNEISIFHVVLQHSYNFEFLQASSSIIILSMNIFIHLYSHMYLAYNHIFHIL